MDTESRGRRTCGESAVSRQQDRPVDLYQLDVFLAVASTGSMSAAAGVLGISQSAVSQTTAQLEQSLGLILIDRARRPLSLTPAGLYISENAEPLIALARRMKAQATEVSKSEGSYLRIGMIDSVANTIGPSLIRMLAARTSALSVQIGMATAQEEALLGRDLDMIISTNPFVDHPAFEHRLLYQESFVAIAGRGERTESLSPTLHTLAASLPFIRFSRTSTLGIRIERILRYNNIDAQRKLEVDHADTMTLLVAQGLGWAITTPTCLMQTGTRFADAVTLVPIDKGNSLRSIFLVTRRGEFLTLSNAIADAVSAALDGLLDAHAWLRPYVPMDEEASDE
ncbi:LysR family transcriptional regulator [Caballeronia sordidicola]|uniref:LysR family transcriptional regulator n=1 Tax=Caballeronia sordidicola TaxID=196367 RepID=A0A158GDE2_CABSO|nr:LysR family transcriptional regulator [Caballeronia sordidicola]